jgi:hypothetical protein
MASVILRDEGSGASVPNVVLLIDTGADITLLPAGSVQRLGVAPIAGLEYELLGFNGTKIVARAVELDVIFLDRAFRGRYRLIESDEGILGRDVLSALVLRLDGPRQEWSGLAD